MAKHPPDVEEKAEAPAREEAAEEVVLRDESDEIIDNLKTQLEGLQNQLSAYRAAEAGQGDGPGMAENQELLDAWSTGLAPHLASRLREPAEELTSRLDRLIEQADDPELRTELERCRDLAYFFYETFQKINNNHRLLTESLTAPSAEMEVAEFCRLIEHALPASGTPLPVEKMASAPRRVVFASRAGVTIIQALVELAATLFGKELRIQVGAGTGQDGTGQDGTGRAGTGRDETGQARFLHFRIFNEAVGAEAAEGESVSSFAMRQGITANTVVDLLYVEKIVELQDGYFSFYRREGRVFGFEVLLPYEAVES